TYLNAAQIVRREHVPAIVHVTGLTQPQGHSTSGSHKRYKTAERLAWEEEFDGLRKMRQWMLEQGIATAAEIEAPEKDAVRRVRAAQESAWQAFAGPVEEERSFVLAVTDELARAVSRPEQREEIEAVSQELRKVQAPQRRDVMAALHNVLGAVAGED